MSNLEKQVTALVRLCTAEDENTRKAAMDELKSLSGSAQKPRPDAKWRIRQVLMQIGMPEHLVGYSYMVRALMMTVADHSSTRGASKPGGLYDRIAKEFNTTASRVERGMRHAIETAWDRCDLDVAAEYFGNTVDPRKGKPTNLEFVARVASAIRDM